MAQPQPPPRVGLMFTTYNTAAVAAYLVAVHVLGLHVPRGVLEVLRSTSAFVAAAVATAYATHGAGVVADMYRRMHPAIPPPLAIALDCVYHFGPAIVLGPPSDPAALVAAYGLVVVWYLAVRKRIQDVYAREFPMAHYDLAAFALLPAFAALLLLRMLHTRR